MQVKRVLQILFGCIFMTMMLYSIWVSTRQPLWEWGGLTQAPDNLWTIATLLDAYFAFITFYIWVLFKERGLIARLAWLVAILLLGNIAISAYVLLQLRRLGPGEPVSAILTK